MCNNIILMIVLSLTIIIYLKTNVHGEIFTAIADIEELSRIEKNFNKFLKQYLIFEEQRLQQIKAISGNLQKEHSSIGANDSQLFLSNPLNIFNLVKRMNFNNSELFKLMHRTTLEETIQMLAKGSESFNLPQNQDLQGISLALSRLQYTYKINVSSLATGKFVPEAPSLKELSARDCFEIGRDHYFLEMYRKAIPWLEEALERVVNEKHKPVLQKVIIKTLARAAYKTKSENVIVHLEESLISLDILHNQTNWDSFNRYLQAVEKYVIANDISIKDKSFITYKRFRQNRIKTDQLCRNERLLNPAKESRLKCYYSTYKSPYLLLHPAKVEDAHLRPWIAVLHDVMSDNEIATVKRLSIPNLKRAIVGDGDIADFRISKSAWLDDFEHKHIDLVSRRLQEITGLNFKQGAESLQVVNYGIAGHYETHHDYDDNIPLGGSTPDSPNGKRIATVLIYMSDVIAGGATVFPHLNISVTPSKGSAVFWYNLMKTGELDPDTEHAACPVIAGSKWVSNKWILEHHQEFRRRCGLSSDDNYGK